jgi:hypothetical protein
MDSDYLLKISKTSILFSKKDIFIPRSVLNYYYHFNDLSKECNNKMKMHFDDSKPLLLLGKFKIGFEENIITFENDSIKIKVFGSLNFKYNTINFNKHRKLKCVVYKK